MTFDQNAGFPRIEQLGLDGFLVRFADRLSDPGNRAALSFREAIEAAAMPGVLETATSLGAVHIRFEPKPGAHGALKAQIAAILAERDWFHAELPHGRRLWHIPTAFGGAAGPQLSRAAALAGLSETQAIEALSNARLRVLTIGFAPGQPYVGELGEAWDLPRQTDLQTRVPPGALALAVRQFVLFPEETPTGWHHVGQTAFRCFRPEAQAAFPLRPGDEILFPAVSQRDLEALRGAADGNGGARWEELA